MPPKSTKSTTTKPAAAAAKTAPAAKAAGKAASSKAAGKAATGAPAKTKSAPKATASAPKPPAAKSAASVKTAAGAKAVNNAAAANASGKAAAQNKPPAPHGIYIKKWGSASAEEAAALFKAAGNVTKTQIRRHRYALVFFDSAAAVKKAIDLFNGKEVLGEVVEITPAKTTPKPDPHENSSCVFVSPIFRSSTTKQQILDLFQGMKVLRLRTYRRNFAYVYLDSPAAAAKFVKEKNGTEFHNHTLRASLSSKSLAKLKARQESAKLLMAAHRHKKTKQQK